MAVSRGAVPYLGFASGRQVLDYPEGLSASMARMTRAPSISLACLLATAAGCFVDTRGGAESSTGATETSAAATFGHSTATGPAEDPPTTGSATEASATSTTSTGPTTMSATDPTDPTDPTGDGTAFCQEVCQVDADCTVEGMDVGYTCQRGRCESSGCTDDLDCRAMFSGWASECVDQAGCPGQVCIDIGGGVGRCATSPSDFIMCETLMMAEVAVPMIEGGIDAIVCANVDYTCQDSVCVNPCEDDAACALLSGHPVCNPDTGTCECSSDEDCKKSGMDGYSACYDGLCGCITDDDCAADGNADICTDAGLCGCSSASVCKNKAFDGTTPVCEAP